MHNQGKVIILTGENGQKHRLGSFFRPKLRAKKFFLANLPVLATRYHSHLSLHVNQEN